MLNFELKVVQARNLKGKDFGGLFSDPFVKIITNQCTQQTTYINNTRNPYWNQSFNIQLYPNETIRFEVWDYDVFGKNDFLGSTSYKPFLNNNRIIDTWLSLNKKGELNIQLIDKNPIPNHIPNYQMPYPPAYNPNVPVYPPPSYNPNILPPHNINTSSYDPNIYPRQVQQYTPQYMPQYMPPYTPQYTPNYPNY